MGVALNLVVRRTASAFHVPAVQPQPSATSLGMSSFHTTSDASELSEYRNEPILRALGNMEGPSICYGHFAVLENKKELDIKEYDNFDAFKNAIDQADCTKLLMGNGPFTLFAPTNTAIENFSGILTEEVIKTHIIPQDLYSDELDGEFETLSGHKVTCKTEFRKIYADHALIGQLDNHTGGTPYPTNAICDNGAIPFNLTWTRGFSKIEARSRSRPVKNTKHETMQSDILAHGFFLADRVGLNTNLHCWMAV